MIDYWPIFSCCAMKASAVDLLLFMGRENVMSYSFGCVGVNRSTLESTTFVSSGTIVFDT